MAFVDIHEIKESQVKLQRDKNFIAAILDAARDLLVVVLDRAGRIEHFNLACRELSGYTLEAVRGKRLSDLLLPPEEVTAVKTTIDDVLSGKASHSESYWLTKDGARRLVSWSNSVAAGDGAVESIIMAGVDVTERQEARDRARESEATVRTLLETAAQAILAIGEDGRIVLANAAAEEMFEYGRDELIGVPADSLVPERLLEQLRQHRAGRFAEPRARTLGVRADLTALRKDGSEFPVEVSLSYVAAGSGTLGVAFVSDITQRKESETTLARYQEQVHRPARALLDAHEAGNRELAREFHDVFSQELAGLSMEISTLLRSAKETAPVTKRLREVGNKISRLAENIHRASRQLHPAILEQWGLEAALREECEALSKQLGMPVAFEAGRLPAQPSQDVALCLYRVAQESLRNIAKHSGAREVHVWLTAVPEGVQLRIEDAGDGFDVEEVLKKGGLGLISMEERVRMVNGKLKVHSVRGEGTTVQVLAPVGGAV